MHTFFRDFCFYVGMFGVISAQMLPDSQAFVMNELEHLYFDYTGPQGFKSGVIPCTNYVDSTTGLNNNTLGRQTSAQWIRTAFHDFVTANVAAGTGGIDASIGFETLRPENVGVAFNDTLFYFTFFFNAKVSMADQIALGPALAIGACGGPPIPFRGGRIDASGAGPFGVPEPQTDLKTTLGEFSGAGFSQEDAIGLTVCGHTMGGVHYSTFPQIVPESAVGPNNTGGRIAFDNTVANFDVNVVQQYVGGYDSKGGPLVTTANEIFRSDLRLYSSDKNATVEKLAQSSDQFRSTCTTLIARMIDMVPRSVTLTPIIDPANLKYGNLSLNVAWSGEMTLSGYFRYIEVATSGSAPESLTVTVIDRYHHVTQTSAQAINDQVDHSNGVYGSTFHYPFTVSFAGSSGLSGIQVGSQQFTLQDSLFVVPILCSISPGLAEYVITQPTHEFTFNITAALRTSTPPPTLKVTISIPVPQPGTVSPKIDSSTTLQLKLIGLAGPFALYSAVNVQNLTSLQLFGSSIDVVDEGSGATAMFFKLFSILQYF